MIEIILISVIVSICSWVFYKIGYCNGHKAGRVMMTRLMNKIRGE